MRCIINNNCSSINSIFAYFAEILPPALKKGDIYISLFKNSLYQVFNSVTLPFNFTSFSTPSFYLAGGLFSTGKSSGLSKT